MVSKTMNNVANVLKALGHPERLRILALLSRGELTVSELVQILDLSQPRITQYIKSLENVGVLQRVKEGSWVFSRISRKDKTITGIIAASLAAIPETDPIIHSDNERLKRVREKRAQSVKSFFDRVADDRDQLGYEYLSQADIEKAMLDIAGHGPFNYMIDMGTGTGRMLEVFAPYVKRGSGLDANVDMLKVARHNLAGRALNHLTVRRADLTTSPLPSGSADLITLHQVLHYLDDPSQAIREAARLLSANGRVLIVDFVTHNLELFREKYAHRRLGFSDEDMATWLSLAGLSLQKTHRVNVNVKGRPDVKIWCAVPDKP